MNIKTIARLALSTGLVLGATLPASAQMVNFDFTFLGDDCPTEGCGSGSLSYDASEATIFDPGVFGTTFSTAPLSLLGASAQFSFDFLSPLPLGATHSEQTLFTVGNGTLFSDTAEFFFDDGQLVGLGFGSLVENRIDPVTVDSSGLFAGSDPFSGDVASWSLGEFRGISELDPILLGETSGTIQFSSLPPIEPPIEPPTSVPEPGSLLALTLVGLSWAGAQVRSRVAA
ncbi:MAG: PEP-CTERM sorting domain-containing protein [Cyanobacteria bacterium P01_D01_bin.115]